MTITLYQVTFLPRVILFGTLCSLNGLMDFSLRGVVRYVVTVRVTMEIGLAAPGRAHSARRSYRVSVSKPGRARRAQSKQCPTN
ncbi:unnamed protein product, partial [Iphiclides podalirius]